MKNMAPPPKIQYISITPEHAGQRIDNFLRTLLKGVPHSMIYRILRKGEVRVNKKRIRPEYKLLEGDSLRLPPIRIAQTEEIAVSTKLKRVAALESTVLYEDDYLLALNKPSGIAVHGGSGLRFGVIEALRALRPNAPFLDLVHRLDRDTSGVLLVAKKRSALRALHEQLREKKMSKRYVALVSGDWPARCHVVRAPLLRRVLPSGERIVSVNPEGKLSETRFEVSERFGKATLLKARPITGRTHQIRVHAQHVGHPVVCDDRYWKEESDPWMAETKLRRLFLHAEALTFIHPKTGEKICLEASLDEELENCLRILRAKRRDRFVEGSCPDL